MSVVESFHFNLPEGVDLETVRDYIGVAFSNSQRNPSVWNGTFLGMVISVCDNHGLKEIEISDFDKYRYCIDLTSFSPFRNLTIHGASLAHIAFSICSAFNASGVLGQESHLCIGKMEGREHIVFDLESNEEIDSWHHFKAYYWDYD